MNQKTNNFAGSKASLINELLAKAGFNNQLIISKPKEVHHCLSLFEQEGLNSPEVIIIDNQKDISYLVVLENINPHFYLGFDFALQPSSNGFLPVNKARGENYLAFSERYTVVFKDPISGGQFALNLPQIEPFS